MDIRRRLERGLARWQSKRRGAAVLVSLVDASGKDGSYDVLFERRARSLTTQPGEVCLPGGSIEAGEQPQEAALREAAEELLVAPSQIQLLSGLGGIEGPGGSTLHAFVGTIANYGGSFSPDEVEHTFRIPLAWFLSHEPQRYEVSLLREFPDDFPWELVPQGRDYAWRNKVDHIPFYDTDPPVWGATARVIDRFVQLMRLGGEAASPSPRGNGNPRAHTASRS